MHIHFIGIGGIGMSALARFYLAVGASVSGSDMHASAVTRDLAREGAQIYIGTHDAAVLPPRTELVVHSAAIRAQNPELKDAKKRKIKTATYAAALGPITKKFKTIAIAGTHGKSTTTAMTSLILEDGYADPTVIVGTKLKEFGGSNFRKGAGPYLVLEADEYDRSFLNYTPHIAVVTSIDNDHLDIYKTVEGVEEAFAKFLSRVPKKGIVVANHDDERVRRVVEACDRRTIWYSMDDPLARTMEHTLRTPGEHNIANALAAATVGRALGIANAEILYALSRFQGTWRRFELMGMMQGAYVYSDYAHHPSAIRTTIQGARERFPFRRIWCVFQPHLQDRLESLWDEFVEAFDMADKICLLPLYAVAGRDVAKTKRGKDFAELAHEVARRGKDVHHAASFEDAKKYLEEGVHAGDVVLVMGAGDIHEFAEDISTATELSEEALEAIYAAL